jgi:hypothetical protein
MFTRFNGNVEPFAKDATGTERTVFGDTAQSDDINDNLNTDFLRGWGIVGVNDNPTKQDFNALAYTISNLVAYLYQQGVSEWNTDQEYYVGSRCIGSNGLVYKALTGTEPSPNTGNNPISDKTNWVWDLLDLKTGQKNLLINGRKLIQQRGVTGGTTQVVLNTRNAGGLHTISFTGTATVTIKEATTLGASDALTSWDTPLATNVASGTTITLTAGKYVHVEFSTTVFDFAQLELGSVATNYAILEDQSDEHLKYYEKFEYFWRHGYILTATNVSAKAMFKNIKIKVPIISASPYSYTNATGIVTTPDIYGVLVVATALSDGQSQCFATIEANAEIFNADDGVGINYKEDRWYV